MQRNVRSKVLRKPSVMTDLHPRGVLVTESDVRSKVLTKTKLSFANKPETNLWFVRFVSQSVC